MTLHREYRNHEIHKNYPLFPDNYPRIPEFYIYNPQFPKSRQFVGFSRSLPDAKCYINKLEDLWYPCITPWMNEWIHLNERPVPSYNLIIEVSVKNVSSRTGSITNVWNNMNEFINWFNKKRHNQSENQGYNFGAIALLENCEDWGVIDLNNIPLFRVDKDPIEYWNPFTKEFASVPQNR